MKTGYSANFIIKRLSQHIFLGGTGSGSSHPIMKKRTEKIFSYEMSLKIFETFLEEGIKRVFF